MRRTSVIVVLAVAVAVLMTIGGVVFVGAIQDRREPPSAGPAPSTSATPAATPSVAPTASPSPSAVPSPTPSPTRPRPSASTSPPTTPATPTLPASLRGKDIEVIPTSRRVVALTFDAGANADGLAPILATLRAEGVRGTFFLTGAFAEEYPSLVRAIVAGGHRLANHSATHPHFPQLSDAAIRSQLADARASIRAAGGTDPRPLFRFPFGDRDAHTIAVVNAAGYACVRWTVDTLGWKGTTEGISAAIVTERVLAAARPGEIVLMHVGSHPKDRSTLDADALPGVIAQLRSRGYGFVTLDALLG